MSTEIFERIYIDDMPTKYFISNLGNCLNSKTNKLLKPHILTKRKMNSLDDIEPNNTYMEYALYFNGKYHYKLIHRLVAETFIPIPEKYIELGFDKNDLEVDHKDNVRYHNYVNNLQWLTPLKNHSRISNQGRERYASGSKHGLCKLTDNQLNLVGQLLEDNILTMNEISSITGIPRKTIHKIKSKKEFVYLSEIYNFDNYNRLERSKIKEDDIRYALYLLSTTNKSLKAISIETGIGYSTIKDLLHNRVHKDICKDYNLSKRYDQRLSKGNNQVEYDEEVRDNEN